MKGQTRKFLRTLLCMFILSVNAWAAFSPADLPNLTLWLDPAAGLYQDTALATPASSDGAAVRGWVDQSGNANHAKGTVSATLKLGANGIGGQPALSFSGDGRLNTTSFLDTAYDRALSMYVVVSIPDNQPFSAALSNGSDQYLWANMGGTPPCFGFKFTYLDNPAAGNTWFSEAQSGSAPVYVIAFTIDGTKVTIRVNNIFRQEYTTAGAGLTGPLTLGGRGVSSYTWPGLIGDIVVYHSGQTQAQTMQVTDYLMKKYGRPGLSILPVVGITGNSWVKGYGAESHLTDIGSDVSRILGNDYAYSIKGTNGITISTLITQSPAEIDPALNVTQNANIFVGWEIPNQLASGTTPAQVVTLLQQWFNDRKTAGWNKRIVLDCLPNSSFEANRQQVNTLLAAQFPTATLYSHVYKAAATTTWADYEVRVSEDPNMGQAGQNTNLTYWIADQIHPNANGYATLAPYVANAILLAATSATSVSPAVRQINSPSRVYAGPNPLPSISKYVSMAGLKGVQIYSLSGIPVTMTKMKSNGVYLLQIGETGRFQKIVVLGE